MSQYVQLLYFCFYMFSDKLRHIGELTNDSCSVWCLVYVEKLPDLNDQRLMGFVMRLVIECIRRWLVIYRFTYVGEDVIWIRFNCKRRNYIYRNLYQFVCV